MFHGDHKVRSVLTLEKLYTYAKWFIYDNSSFAMFPTHDYEYNHIIVIALWI